MPVRSILHALNEEVFFSRGERQLHVQQFQKQGLLRGGIRQCWGWNGRVELSKIRDSVDEGVGLWVPFVVSIVADPEEWAQDCQTEGKPSGTRVSIPALQQTDNAGNFMRWVAQRQELKLVV